MNLSCIFFQRNATIIIVQFNKYVFTAHFLSVKSLRIHYLNGRHLFPLFLSRLHNSKQRTITPQYRMKLHIITKLDDKFAGGSHAHATRSLRLKLIIIVMYDAGSSYSTRCVSIRSIIKYACYIICRVITGRRRINSLPPVRFHLGLYLRMKTIAKLLRIKVTQLYPFITNVNFL